MSILCYCPKCEQTCGFKDVYAGRTARCLNCQCQFIIPPESGQKGLLLPAPPETELEGFYRAVLIDGWKVFVQKESIMGLVLCIFLTCLHFFVGDTDYSFTVGAFRPPLVLGWAATIISAGVLLWYFMEIINNAAMDNDFLPDIFMGSGFSFFGEVFKSIYLFITAFAVAAIPGVILSICLEQFGLGGKIVNVMLLVLTMSLTPMMLSMLGCALQPWKLFRYDLIFRMICKTPGPYLLTSAITLGALMFVFLTLGFFSTNPETAHPKAIFMLTARIGAVLIMIYAMQTIGLYARHYYRCFPQLNSDAK